MTCLRVFDYSADLDWTMGPEAARDATSFGLVFSELKLRESSLFQVVDGDASINKPLRLKYGGTTEPIFCFVFQVSLDGFPISHTRGPGSRSALYL